jgi:hypothetical protein
VFLDASVASPPQHDMNAHYVFVRNGKGQTVCLPLACWWR